MKELSLNTYVCDSLADAYDKIYEDMILAPTVETRGLVTKEILAPQILIKYPRNRISYHKDRKFGLKFAITESLLLFSKSNELKYASRYNETMANYSDDGKTLFGSYGERISINIKKAIDKLRDDPNSRQVVLPILGKNDVYKDTKDTPCTQSLQLILRDGYLNMIVNMRSNDIMWGLPYDMFMFSRLQEVVANELGVELGWYLHRPASLHLYDYHIRQFVEVASKFSNETDNSLRGVKYDEYVKEANTFIKQVDAEEKVGLRGLTTVDKIYNKIKQNERGN